MVTLLSSGVHTYRNPRQTWTPSRRSYFLQLQSQWKHHLCRTLQRNQIWVFGRFLLCRNREALLYRLLSQEVQGSAGSQDHLKTNSGVVGPTTSTLIFKLFQWITNEPFLVPIRPAHHNVTLKFKCIKAPCTLGVTSDSDVDGVAALPPLRLAPVHSCVWWIGILNGTVGLTLHSPAGAQLRSQRGGVSLESPATGVSRHRTGQIDRVIPEELRSVGVDGQCGWKI